MTAVERTSLAWALADGAKSFLPKPVRALLCAKIGAGEPEAAITDLLDCYATSKVELPAALVVTVRAWVRGYAGTAIEPQLRCILDRIPRTGNAGFLDITATRGSAR